MSFQSLRSFFKKNTLSSKQSRSSAQQIAQYSNEIFTDMVSPYFKSGMAVQQCNLSLATVDQPEKGFGAEELKWAQHAGKGLKRLNHKADVWIKCCLLFDGFVRYSEAQKERMSRYQQSQELNH